MPKKKETGATSWVDPDDAPELTKEWFEAAEIREGDRVIRTGRPKSDNAKQLVSLRLDPEVIAHFKKRGAGWQTRINAALRQVAKVGVERSPTKKSPYRKLKGRKAAAKRA